jgi:glucose/arabinose dehydrogenase
VTVRTVLGCALAAVLLTACGSSGARGPVGIGVGLSGPGGLQARIYSRGLPHVSALAYDSKARLWATTSGATTHAGDGVYLVRGAGQAPLKVVGRMTAPLGLVWVGNRLIVSSLGRVTEFSGFDGRRFRHTKVIVAGPVTGGENNNIVLAPNGRLVLGVSASCDHCVPTNKWSATIVSFKTDGSDLRVLASGIRAAYGLAYFPGTSLLFASMNQRDDLGAHTPGDWLAIVHPGQNWGFPRCHGQTAPGCASEPGPVGVLDAHAAAGGVALLTGQLAGRYRPSALVAEWQLGSVQRVALRKSGGGYTGETTTFLTGFKNPLPVITTANGGVLVGDWGSGTVYEIDAV